jgi:hypothetical protein
MRLLALALRRGVRNLKSGFGFITLICFCLANVYFYFAKCRLHQGAVTICLQRYILLDVILVVGAFFFGTVYNAVAAVAPRRQRPMVECRCRISNTQGSLVTLTNYGGGFPELTFAYGYDWQSHRFGNRVVRVTLTAFSARCP